MDDLQYHVHMQNNYAQRVHASAYSAYIQGLQSTAALTVRANNHQRTEYNTLGKKQNFLQQMTWAGSTLVLYYQDRLYGFYH